MKVRFTHHAHVSMRERGISVSQITGALRRPDSIVEVKGSANGCLKKFGKQTLMVVFRQTVREYVIITAYYL